MMIVQSRDLGPSENRCMRHICDCGVPYGPHLASLSGISTLSSSIPLRMQVNEGEGSFCSWLQNLVTRICNLFGIFSSSNVQAQSTIVNHLEKRVSDGKQIIENHFQRDFIAHANEQQSIIVVVMKYNNRSVVSYGRTAVQKNQQDAIKAQLQQLLSQTTHQQNDNGYLEVSTIFFKKNNARFEHSYVSNSRRYCSENNSGEGSGQAASLSLAELNAIMNINIPSQQDRRRVLSLLSQL